MKRTTKQIFSEALLLVRQDLRNFRVAIGALAIYFFLMEAVLHNGCLFVVFTGFPCPACGLTRAGLHLLKGEFLEAAALNIFIYPILVLICLFFVYRYILKKSAQPLVKAAVGLIPLMVAYYLYRMYRFFPGEPPMSYYPGNLMVRLRNLFL